MIEDGYVSSRCQLVENKTSVSGLLSQLVQEKREKESRYLGAYQEFLAEGPSPLSGGQSYPGRDSLYGR